MNKKKQQLGIDPGTASHRLVRDLLWSFIVADGFNFCYHCNESMTRDNFSIEHKEPWLDSENPLKLYFDLDNISYSHRVCNIKAARRPNKIYNSTKEKRDAENKVRRNNWKKYGKQNRNGTVRASRSKLTHG